MPSLSVTSSGRWIVQFGKPKRTLSLGRISAPAARDIRSHVAQILSHQAAGWPIPLATAQWLGSIGDDLYEKLVKLGLVPLRASQLKMGLAAMVDALIARRTDLKRRTRSNLRQTRAKLVEFFGNILINDISKATTQDFKRHLATTLATATVAMHVKKAKQFFADAVDRRLLDSNPFAGLAPGSQTNASKMFYIRRPDAYHVISCAPSIEWQTLLAMARFGGVRVPSEIAGMLWADVLVDQNKLVVRSPKTEHHQGRETRVIPIFPAFAKYLWELMESQPEGTTHVFPNLRRGNLWRPARKIIERAGLKPWPRLWQNMRASCETDLTVDFPLHVVCQWIGNTAPVAVKHYLQVTDEHFEQAAPRAARRAAPIQASERDFAMVGAGTPDEKPHENSSEYPLGADSRSTNPKEKLKSVERALQQALQAYARGSAAFRARAIRRLGKLVRAAREHGC